jgi:hypothetical protein
MASGLVAGPPEVEAQVSANAPSGRRRTALIACGIPQVPASTRIPVGLREPRYAPFPIWIWLIGHEWAKREKRASVTTRWTIPLRAVDPRLSLALVPSPQRD